ncbi:hypothetical protein QE152_g6 [Popillia japonica]|uniref:Uncharacterized protein n=1 Tax=Popillia japonica TaxID=7064 RepID=A0AAW1NKK0_POPJA
MARQNQQNNRHFRGKISDFLEKTIPCNIGIDVFKLTANRVVLICINNSGSGSISPFPTHSTRLSEFPRPSSSTRPSRRSRRVRNAIPENPERQTGIYPRPSSSTRPSRRSRRVRNAIPENPERQTGIYKSIGGAWRKRDVKWRRERRCEGGGIDRRRMEKTGREVEKRKEM